jgi:hypothetical protein
MNAERIQSVNFDSNVDNYDSDDSEPEAIQQAPASTDGHGQSFEKISKNIFSLIAFGRIVARNQKNLDDALTLLPNPGRPDFIPPKLASMSTKHTSTSPEGRNASTPVENGRKRKRGPIEDESPTRKTNFHLRPAEKGALTVAVIEKWHNPCVEREIQLLFKLQCCRNVVQLLNYESLHAASSWRLVEERLVEFPENWKHFRAEQGMPAACQYLLDGVMALSALTQNRIIHRDVSSGNFLWSPQDRCFKLLDFDSAVQIDPETVKIEYPQRPVCSDGGEMQYQPVGTGRYIAPELFKGAAYSWRTDLFSLGISFCRGWLEQVVQYNSLWPDYDLEKENRKVYKLLRQTVCGLIIEKDPTKRASSLPGLMGKLLEIYRKINSYYRRKPDYYRTVYDNIVESIPADQPLDDWMLSPDNLNDVNMMNGHEVTATG